MKPFYVIGHNTNSLENFRAVLEAGANALDPDVEWHDDDFVIAHDPGTSGPRRANS